MKSNVWAEFSHMFAYQGYDVKPDIVTCAKALGCGVPVGAFAASENIAAAFELKLWNHLWRQSICGVAVSKVFDIFESKNILDNVNKMGEYLSEKLQTLVNDYDIITGYRGKGLMQGLEFSIPVKDISADSLDMRQFLYQQEQM